MKSKLLKKNNFSKEIIIFTVLLLSAISPVFAQQLPGGLNSLMDNILGIFTSGFVKGILICCLCGCAVAYGFNKDNEKMKRNIIAIGIAVGILVCASQIVDWVWAASK